MVGYEHTSLASGFKYEDLRTWSACLDTRIDKIMQAFPELHVLTFISRTGCRYGLLLKASPDDPWSLRPRPYRPLLGVLVIRI